MKRLFRTLAGRPFPVEPTPEELASREAQRKKFNEDYKRTHPPHVERISGCCDPPLQEPKNKG